MFGDPSAPSLSRPDDLTLDTCAADATASHAQAPESEVWDAESFRRPGERTNREVHSVHIGRERAEMGQERFLRGVPGGVPGEIPPGGRPEGGSGGAPRLESGRIGDPPKVGACGIVMEGREAGFEVRTGLPLLVGCPNLQSEVEKLPYSPS